MATVSTFGAFTSARLGMYAAMKGLSVTGQNISNINTRGYSRQVLDQKSLKLSGTDRYYSAYDARVGSGVLCTGVSQLRDPYLDIRYRNEQASVGSMDAKLSALDDLSAILDEVGKGDGNGMLEKQFNELMKQLNNLTLSPNSQENDGLVRASASTLVTLLNNYAKRLDGVAADYTTSYEQDLKDVNSILENIGSLSENIQKSELHGDPALELRDQRNLLLDQLSVYAKVNITYENAEVAPNTFVQKLVIKLDDGSNTVLVDGAHSSRLSRTQIAQKNPNYDPAETDPTLPGFGEYLDANGAGTADINAAKQIDNPDFTLQRSELKDRHGRPHPTENTTTALGNKLFGALESTRKMLTEAGEFTVNGAGTAAPSTNRGIPYYQNSMDALATKLASAMNDANRPYQVDSEGYYLNAAGARIEEPLTGIFLNKGTALSDDQKKLLEKNGNRVGGTLFSNSNTGNNTGGINASNISISADWTSGQSKIQISDQVGSTSPTNVAHIIYILSDASHTFTPSDVVNGASNTPFFTGTFQKMFSNTCSTLASDRMTTTTMLENYATAATSLNASRDSVAGVDLNDEAANMMQYQKSYSAAARLMTTIDEALDKLINGTGMVGR